MQTSLQRNKVRFASGSTTCAAWHYPGNNGACVIMAGGFGVTKEPGTDRFAGHFNQAGFSVLAFDFRNLGESGGEPRQVIRLRGQVADWRAAIEFAATLPEVDPARIAIWSFSLEGGMVLQVAAANANLAAAIAQMPLVDGLAALRNQMRHTTKSAMVKLTARGLRDACRALIGKSPLLVPLSGAPGTVALLSTPDAIGGADKLDPANTGWLQEVAARSALGAGNYRPQRFAAKVRCPLLFVVCEQDQAVLPGPAIRAAGRARRGELVTVPGGHYAPFTHAHEQAVEAELDFLHRHLTSAR
jgi:uncharacterized protein